MTIELFNQTMFVVMIISIAIAAFGIVRSQIENTSSDDTSLVMSYCAGIVAFGMGLLIIVVNLFVWLINL